MLREFFWVKIIINGCECLFGVIIYDKIMYELSLFSDNIIEYVIYMIMYCIIKEFI